MKKLRLLFRNIRFLCNNDLKRMDDFIYLLNLACNRIEKESKERDDSLIKNAEEGIQLPKNGFAFRGGYKIQFGHFVGEHKYGVQRDFIIDYELGELTEREVCGHLNALFGAEFWEEKGLGSALSTPENHTTFILGSVKDNKGYRVVQTDYFGDPTITVKGSGSTK